MTRLVFAVAAAAVALLPPVSSVRAQAIPSPAQAQALLQSRPDVAAQLRQRIATSGLSADQVRARLRGAGFSEGLLNSYLPGGSPTSEPPSNDVFEAIRRLGIAGSDDVESLRTMLRDTLSTTPARDRQELTRPLENSADVIFGLDLFRAATAEFLPTLDGPVDANYRLGPGDQLVLILTGDVELAYTLDVTREGFVVIPQVGQIGVANLTMSQLESLLYSRLSRSYSGVRRGADAPTKFSVSVSKLRSVQVYLTGDVVRPSSYRISSAATAMTALYAGGGPSETGSLRAVSVRRGGQVVATLDVYDYLLRGDNSRDIRLENGDVVFVPTHGPRVRIEGAVVREGTYELAAGETLRDAIRHAGGFGAEAITRRVQVDRIVPPAERTLGGSDRSVIDVTAANDSPMGLPAIPMVAGDRLHVYRVADRIRNSIAVNGHVWSSGRQAFTPGMTLSQALRAAGGLKPDAYLGQVLVARLRPDSTRIQMRAAIADTTGAMVNDMPLADDDDIRVFSLTNFRPSRFVAIGGSVRNGGQFPWHEGITLRDLVLLSGGLREGAYLREAEVARLPQERERGTTAITIRVPLDSSYLGDFVVGTPYRGAPGQPASPAGTAPEVTLQPYDNVLILQQPDWQLQRTVILSGEVRFPGRYALKSKSERISDLILRAGGVTSAADAGAAYFSRVRAATAFAAEDSLAERRREAERARDGRDTTERIRVGVALDRALARPQSDENLILLDDDSLHVPFRRTTVEISGAVNAPTAVTVNGRRSITYYVSAGGGASSVGDARNAYVVQPNGKIESSRRFLWIIPRNPRPRAGATVVVPLKAATSATSDRLASISIIVQTIASLATVVAILK